MTDRNSQTYIQAHILEWHATDTQTHTQVDRETIRETDKQKEKYIFVGRQTSIKIAIPDRREHKDNRDKPFRS